MKLYVTGVDIRSLCPDQYAPKSDETDADWLYSYATHISTVATTYNARDMTFALHLIVKTTEGILKTTEQVIFDFETSQLIPNELRQLKEAITKVETVVRRVLESNQSCFKSYRQNPQWGDGTEEIKWNDTTVTIEGGVSQLRRVIEKLDSAIASHTVHFKRGRGEG